MSANTDFEEEGDGEIEMEPVSSTNIASLGWKGQVLRVAFTSGGAWRYEGVPRSVYEAVRDAGSVGKEFNKLIKGSYPGSEE